MRPYFPLDNVLTGCFDHFSKLFDLEFKPASGYQTWHEDVKAFELFEKSTGDFVGTLFGDFFPRTGKKQGAWMTAYRGQGLYNGKVERPVIAIVCNFTKPTAEKPSLLSLAPSIILLMTCFTRIVIVLSFVRTALSLQGAPSNQIIVGLSIFMTFFIMSPADSMTAMTSNPLSS